MFWEVYYFFVKIVVEFMNNEIVWLMIFLELVIRFRRMFEVDKIYKELCMVVFLVYLVWLEVIV